MASGHDQSDESSVLDGDNGSDISQDILKEVIPGEYNLKEDKRK